MKIQIYPYVISIILYSKKTKAPSIMDRNQTCHTRKLVNCCVCMYNLSPHYWVQKNFRCEEHGTKLNEQRSNFFCLLVFNNQLLIICKDATRREK